MTKKVTKIALISMSLLALSTSVGTVATQQAQPVQAASFTHYVYAWGDTPHQVVVKKPITIRKVMFNHNNVGIHLGKKRYLRRGDKIRVRAYGNSGAYWIMGHNWRWTYPHKTDNWFKLYKPSSHRKATKKKPLTRQQKINKLNKLQNKVNKLTAKPYLEGDMIEGYFANIPTKGVMQFSIDHRLGMQHGFEMIGSFTNTSNKLLNLNDYLNNYFTYRLPENYMLHFHTNQVVQPNSTVKFKAVTDNPEWVNDINSVLMETRTDADVKLPFIGLDVPCAE